MARSRTLVVDANLNKRLSTELNARGRRAVSVYELHVAELKDPELLNELCRMLKDFILVSGDYRMPLEHETVLAQLGVTLASIDPRPPAAADVNPDQWSRDVVHRWAHSMQDQQEGTIRRYALRAHRLWTRSRAMQK